MINQKSFESMSELLKRRDEILELPTEVFSKYRLIILAALWREGELDFKQFLECIPKISEGNLSGHLRILRKIGVVDVNKEFIDNRPRTTFILNTKGRKLIEDVSLRFQESFSDILGVNNSGS